MKNILFLNKLMPGVQKRYLFTTAGFVWSVASAALLWRGCSMLLSSGENSWTNLIISLITGLMFYFLGFYKIPAKHILRIQSLAQEKSCLFSFLSFKGYLLMALMITGGIVLRNSALIPINILSVIYLAMGIPLAISAIKFFVAFFNNRIQN